MGHGYKKLNILGLHITNSTYEEIIKKIKEHISQKQKYLIHNVNPYILLEAMKNQSFYKMLSSFSDLYLDGIGLFLASKLLYGKNSFKEKITGTDLYPYLFRLADKNKYKIFLWGGSDLANQKITDVISLNYPRINLIANFSRNFSDLNYIKSQININSPEMVFIGLGSPIQEKIAYDLFQSCDVKFIICVGSGLDYMSGTYKRAPLFFQKIGLEWFYRLLFNPIRYWKRYLIGIPLFIYRIIKLKVEYSFSNNFKKDI
jgi:N-acetylglucosaminyldiphosphoundecaprenol N-acetyl-beta-D-mannosaminyltransferase